MKTNIENQTTKYNIRYQRRRRWYKVLSFLSAVVVFVTTYALIIPAITWEKTLICEKKEHIHDASCYTVDENSEIRLTCQIEEHIHGDECFDAPPAADDGFVCGFPEHMHSDECYFSDGTLKCTLSEHTHSEECIAQAKKLHDDTVSQCRKIIDSLDADDIDSVSDAYDSLNEMYQPFDDAYYGEQSISQTEYNSLCKMVDEYSDMVDALTVGSAVGKIMLLGDETPTGKPVDFADTYGKNRANEWQVVSGEEGKTVYTLVENEDTKKPVLRLKKTILPAGNEDEFYICLTVEPVFTRDLKEMLGQMSLIVSNSKNDVEGIDFGFSIDQKSSLPHDLSDKKAFGFLNSQFSFLIDRNLLENGNFPSWACNGSKQKINIDTVEMVIPNPEKQGSYITVRKEQMNAVLALPSLGANGTLIYCVPNPDPNSSTKFLTFKTKNKVNQEGTTLYIPDEVYEEMLNHGADLMQWLDPVSDVKFNDSSEFGKIENDTLSITIKDQLGDYIDGESFQILEINGKADYDDEEKMLRWSLANVEPNKDLTLNEATGLDDPNSAYEYVTGDEDANGNIIKEYYAQKNAYQLIYKIKLDTAKEGFKGVSQLSELDDTKEEKIYDTNSETKIQYKLTENENKIYFADFESPTVRGGQYSFRTQLVDIDTDEPLPDGEFTLTDSSGKPVNVSFADDKYVYSPMSGGTSAAIRSDSSGYVTVSGLPPGKYSLKETKAPPEYSAIDENKDGINEDFSVTDLSYVKYNTFEVKDLIIKNKKCEVYSLELLKRSDTGSGAVPLANVKFGIYDGNVSVYELETDSSGKASLPDDVFLNVGTEYTLKEISPPDGYSPPSDTIRFKVDEAFQLTTDTNAVSGYTDISLSGKLLHITVINVPGVELPATGGTGTVIIYISGILLISAAAFMHYCIYKNKRRPAGEE